MRALGRRIEQYFRPQAWGKRPVADLRAGNGEFSIGARFELARCRLPPAVFWRRGDLRVRPFYFDRCSPGQRRRLLGPLLTFIREVHVSQVGRDGPPMLVPLPVFIGTGSGTRPGGNLGLSPRGASQSPPPAQSSGEHRRIDRFVPVKSCYRLIPHKSSPPFAFIVSDFVSISKKSPTLLYKGLKLT